MIIFNDLNTLMESRGFTLHSDGKNSYDFVDSNSIHCSYWIGNSQFEFVFVTPAFHKLSSGEASPIDKDDHFARLYNKFKKEVELLTL